MWPGGQPFRKWLCVFFLHENKVICFYHNVSDFYITVVKVLFFPRTLVFMFAIVFFFLNDSPHHHLTLSNIRVEFDSLAQWPDVRNKLIDQNDQKILLQFQRNIFP